MTTEAFRPTHVVPREGLPAWEAPDPSRPTVPLDALLPVELADRRGDWGRVVCANGWSAWVDGRLLVPVPQDPPAAGRPLARTADPRPLLARAEHALDEYRRAVDDLARGGLDGETFHRRTQGLRIGVVVDGDSLWLYESEHERWVYCDGERFSTYAAERGPGVDDSVSRGGGDGPRGNEEPTRLKTGAAEVEPTRVVRPGETDGPPDGPAGGTTRGPASEQAEGPPSASAAGSGTVPYPGR